MNKIPFSLYDFFGYLSAGFIWLISVDFLFGQGLLIGHEPNWITTTFFIVLAYIIGHINAHLASWLIEKRIIGMLGYPSQNLFNETNKKQRFFKDFRMALPIDFRQQIIAKYSKKTGSKELGESMFLYCYHTVKEKCPKTYDRLQLFISLYGFSRNMSFSSLFIGIALAIKAFVVKDIQHLYIGLVVIVISYILFLRMLKFYRHYSVEVFSAYGTMGDE